MWIYKRAYLSISLVLKSNLRPQQAHQLRGLTEFLYYGNIIFYGGDKMRIIVTEAKRISATVSTPAKFEFVKSSPDEDISWISPCHFFVPRHMNNIWAMIGSAGRKKKTSRRMESGGTTGGH